MDATAKVTLILQSLNSGNNNGSQPSNVYFGEMPEFTFSLNAQPTEILDTLRTKGIVASPNTTFAAHAIEDKNENQLRVKIWKVIPSTNSVVSVWNVEGTHCLEIPTCHGGEYDGYLRLSDIQRTFSENEITGVLEIPYSDPQQVLKFLEDARQNRTMNEMAQLPRRVVSRTTMEGHVSAREVEYYLRPKDTVWKKNCTYKATTLLDAVCGLALSGGGNRAMLMHLGACQRMMELGDLLTRDTIASVSGGSILSGFLVTVWETLKSAAESVEKSDLQELFDILVAEPVREFAKLNVALPILLEPASMLADQLKEAEDTVKKIVINRCKENPQIMKKYPHIEEWLRPKFGDSLAATLPELKPDPNSNTQKKNPTFFIFCSCDANTGNPFYFTQDYVGPKLPSDQALVDLPGKYGINELEGRKLAQEVKLCQAIAASAAFPAFYPFPFPYTSKNNEKQTANLVDGGVFDNLGLEPLNYPNIYLQDTETEKFSKRPHQIIYVSDAGMPLDLATQQEYPIPVFSMIMRTLSIVMAQLGKRRIVGLKEGYRNNLLYGAAWRIEDLWDYYTYITRYNRANDKYADHYKKHADLLTKELPKEGYPNLEELFGFKLGVIDDGTRAKAFADMVKKLMAVRTDMDLFYPDEQEILETLGYTLAAYRIRLYCPYKLALGTSKPFNPRNNPTYNKWLKINPNDPNGLKGPGDLTAKVIKALENSDSAIWVHKNNLSVYQPGLKRLFHFVSKSRPEIKAYFEKKTNKLRELRNKAEQYPKEGVWTIEQVPPFSSMGMDVNLQHITLQYADIIPKVLDSHINSKAHFELHGSGQPNASTNSDTTIELYLRGFTTTIKDVDFKVSSMIYEESGKLDLKATGESTVCAVITITGQETKDWKIGCVISVQLGEYRIVITKANRHTIISPSLASVLSWNRIKTAIEARLGHYLTQKFTQFFSDAGNNGTNPPARL